jgi:hypothetical protein
MVAKNPWKAVPGLVGGYSQGSRDHLPSPFDKYNTNSAYLNYPKSFAAKSQENIKFKPCKSNSND